MKKLLIVSMAFVMLASCKKEKNVETTALPKNYISTWSNIIPAAPNTPLDYFSLQIFLNEGGTGFVNSTRLVNGFVYAQGTATWQKTANDSVIIAMDLPAYPKEIWELRGISNSKNTEITANIYRYPKINSSEVINFGQMILKK